MAALAGVVVNDAEVDDRGIGVVGGSILLSATPPLSNPPDSLPRVSSAEFKLGMRQVATPTAIATSNWQGERAGLTVSSFCSLNSDPPRMLVCVSRTAGAYPFIEQGGSLAINVLARHHDALALRFASGDACAGEARFESGHWGVLKTGAPILMDSVVTFDCCVLTIHQTDTHGMVIADVVDVRCEGSEEPLVYRDGKFVTVEH